MNVRSTSFVWLLALVVISAEARAAEAPQQAPPLTSATPSDQPAPAEVRRPYRGLFGAPDDPSKQALTLSGSAFAAYDDDVLSDGGSANPSFSNSGRGKYGGVSAGLEYSRPGRRASVGLTGDVGVNRYVAQDRTTTMYRTGGDVALRLTPRTTLSAGGSLAYAPTYRLGLFISPTSLTGSLDPFATVVPDYDLFSLEAYRTAASLRLSQSIGRRSSLDGWYSIMRVNYVDEPLDYGSMGAGGRFTHRLTRNLGLRLGYSYDTAKYEARQSLRPQRVHNIDAGVDYGRALSVSRRTKFSFSTGSAVLVRETPVSSTPTTNEVNYRIIGGADLTHEMGRTWTAQLAYRRGIDFREGFYDPFLTDGVSARLGGLFSPRLRFSSSVDYSFGSVGVGTSTGFNSYSANAGLEVGLTRALALYGRYVYYAYDFDGQVALDPRFSRTLNRQGVRVGLSASIPLVR